MQAKVMVILYFALGMVVGLSFSDFTNTILAKQFFGEFVLIIMTRRLYVLVYIGKPVSNVKLLLHVSVLSLFILLYSQ